MKHLIRTYAWLLLFFNLSIAWAQQENLTVIGSRTGGGTTFDAGNVITTDKSGNFYTAGQFTGTITFGTISFVSGGKEDIYVLKTNGSGGVLWAIQMSGDDIDNVTGIGLDSYGRIYVTGYFKSSALDVDGISYTNTATGTTDAFVCKIDQQNGGVLWFKNMGGTGSDVSNDLYIDKFDQLYVTGYFEDKAFFDLNEANSVGKKDVFLARYDSLGTNIWVEQSGGELDDHGSDLATDSIGTIYVTGSFASPTLTAAFFTENNREPNGTTDVFVCAYDSTRIPIWLFTGGGFDNDLGNAIAIDTVTSELYITGSYTNLALFGGQSVVNEVITGKSLYILKLDDAGNTIWATKGDGERCDVLDIALDTSGNIYTTGSFSESLNFGCTGVTEWFDNYGKVNTDIFVTKHKNTGEFVSVNRTGSRSKPDEGRGLRFNALANRVHIIGYFTDTCVFGPDERYSKGVQDIFAATIQSQANACGVPTRFARIIKKKLTPACAVSADTIFATGYTGKLTRWEYSTNNALTFTPIPDVKTPYLVIGEVPANNTVYRAVVQSCDCAAEASDTIRASVIYAPTKGGKIAGSKTLCILGNTGTLTLSNNVGAVVRWETSTDKFVANVVALPVTISNLTYTNLTFNTFVRAVVKNGLCAEAYSDTAFLSVDSCEYCNHARTIGGVTRITSNNTPACITGGTVVNISLTGHLGTVTRWEVSEDGFASIVAYPGGATTFSLPNVLKKTWVRAQIKNLTCFPETSKAVVIDVDSCEACGFLPSIAGNIKLPVDSVCNAGNTGLIKLQNYFGTILYWEYARQEEGPYFRIRNITDTLRFNNLTLGRWYRAVVKADFCRQDTTLPVFLKVRNCVNCPMPTNAKITRITDKTASIDWKGHQSAHSYQVQYRQSGNTSWTSINITAPPLTITGLLPDQTYQVRIRALCSGTTNAQSDYTFIFTFTTSCSSPGPLFEMSGQNSVCRGQNTINLRLTNPVGEVVRWEYSTNNFRTVSRLNQRSTILVVENIVSTTAFRAVVQNFTCIQVASDPITINVIDCGNTCAKPTTLIAKNMRPTSADLLWAFPANVDFFEISYRSPQQTGWTTISGLSDQVFTLTGLQTNTEYSVRLRNICSNGVTSEYGDTIRFRTTTPPANCQPPASVSITPTLTEAVINITPVAGVVNYEIQYRAANSTKTTTVSSETETVTLRNLVPNTAYRLIVRTNCGNKFSNYTTEFSFNTQVPSCTVPQNVRIANITRTTAKVFWDVVIHANQYTLRYRPTGTSVWSNLNLTTNMADLVGLRTATRYEVQVQANCLGVANSSFSVNTLFFTSTTREEGLTVEIPVTIYPNPNRGIFFIQTMLDASQTVAYSLADVNGRILFSESLNLESGMQEIPVSTAHLSSGVYFLTWEADGMKRNFKVIVE